MSLRQLRRLRKSFSLTAGQDSPYGTTARCQGPCARFRYPQLDDNCNKNLAKDFFYSIFTFIGQGKGSENLTKTLLLRRLIPFFQCQKCRGDVNPALLAAHFLNKTLQFYRL